ncbi:MAG TPA: hypothetical protein VMT62_17345 [Syntrophorhabdaceae bacterium]|nr:hypothetical protein [Syntrophorhabdaceae bacterium]
MGLFIRRGLCLSSICLFLIICGSFSQAVGGDDIAVTKDKDKTTYTIGSSQTPDKNGKTEEDRDKEQAWEMLKKMNIIIDQRGQNGQQSGQ